MFNITLATAILVLAGIGPVELPEYEPAGVAAYTADLELDGYVNGKMDSSRMLTVAGCSLERDAAYTYSLMVEAAAQNDITLRTEDCYRSYRRQDAAFNRRCPLTSVPVYNDAGAQTGTRTVRICTGPPTARAGESNHGWGRAIDFRDQRGVLSCYDREFDWLKLNAHRFGWVHPEWARCGLRTQEPWHWEYAGVTDPTLVDYVSLNPALIAVAE
jgi:LAS superfamily LD-carboxypeptidase LdcB